MQAAETAENQTADAPRAALAQAIERAAEAGRAAAAARAAAERGRELVASVRRALDGFQTLDERVAAFHAGLIRSNAGRAALPPDLVEGRRLKQQAAENLADAEAASAVLDGEAATVQAGAEAAGAAVRMYISAVCDGAVDATITRLRLVEAEAARLRGILAAYASSRTPLDGAPSSTLWALLREPAHEALLSAHNYRWQAPPVDWPAFKQALASDPDAVLEAAG